MATLAEKIKHALAALEAAGKALSAVDADIAEANAAAGVRDIRLNEVAEAETRLARIREETVQADAEFARWRKVTAKEQSATNAATDVAQGKLRVLLEQIKEAEGRHANIIAGISALHARLRK
jgi:hypothetical protein